MRVATEQVREPAKRPDVVLVVMIVVIVSIGVRRVMAIVMRVAVGRVMRVILVPGGPNDVSLVRIGVSVRMAAVTVGRFVVLMARRSETGPIQIFSVGRMAMHAWPVWHTTDLWHRCTP